MLCGFSFVCCCCAQILHLPGGVQEAQGVHHPAEGGQQRHPVRGKVQPPGRHERCSYCHDQPLPLL